jgi:hypothetical protein
VTHPPTITPRRKRWGLRLVVSLLVLVGLLIAADRVAVVVAERAAADTLQRSQDLPQRPDVSINGFPFLTQLASRTFGEVEIGVDDLVAGRGDATITVTKLRLRLHDVHLSDGFRSATARTGTASALLSYSELSRVLGVRLSYAGSGSVVTNASVTVAGATVSGRLSARPVLSAGELRFTDIHAAVEGVGIPGADAVLAAVLDRPVDVSHLPFGLRVDGFAARADGVSITLTAANLTFRR